MMETNKKSPAFQLYAQDFISSLDVQTMTAAEVGAYCLLLFNSWIATKQGYIPNNERQLQHISRLSPEEWKQSKKVLLAKFPATPDGKYRYNPRLASEAEKQADFRLKQAENGKRGGRPRREQPNVNPCESQENPGLNDGLAKPKPEKALPFSSSTSSSNSSSSFQSEEAAPSEDAQLAADLNFYHGLTPDGENQPTESPAASASQTEGGAADVPTRKPKAKPAAFTPPTAEQMLAYMQQQRPFNPPADVERVAARCFGHYSGNGWKVGRNPMKSWEGACQTFLADLPKLTEAAPAAMTIHRNHHNAGLGSSTGQPSQVAARTQQAVSMMNAYEYDDNGNRLGRRS